MTGIAPLPPGQRERNDFPRFGLFPDRFPKHPGRIHLRIVGDVDASIAVSDELLTLPRVVQTSDFHCVTTWTKRALPWSGFRFADFFHRIVVPRAAPHAEACLVVFRCQDGYATSLPLADLLSDDVLLADTLEGAPLPIAHGAPLRLIAPAHYGYKNPKHLSGIEFWRTSQHYRSTTPRVMDHPRARVAQEERGRGIPAWLLRRGYRLSIRPTIISHRRALKRYLAQQQRAIESDPNA